MVLFLFFLILRRIYILFFFFSSRRRHTRFSRDWSSDVCSSDLEPIAQEMGERTARERDAADRASGLERSLLGDDPPPTQVGHQQVEAAELEIAPKDGPHPLGLLLNHDNLAVPGRVSQGDDAADPQPLALGSGDFVADALGSDLPLELGK